jgi:hypothetical protein
VSNHDAYATRAVIKAKKESVRWNGIGTLTGCFSIGKAASITASATFGHSASPDNVTCWYIMALPCALKIYVKYFDNFLSPEPIAFQSFTNVFLFQWLTRKSTKSNSYK